MERELLGPFEGNAVIQAVSPRVFEAAALGTAMINFPGRYSDVVEPWAHYIPLEKDFSNFDEVVGAIRDDSLLETITARAHADLVASGRYSLQSFVSGFDREIEGRARPVPRRRPAAAALQRRLRALEHLRSPRRLAEVPFVASQRTRALEREGRRLIHRFPEIEALAHASEQERLQHDLVRLATAAAAHLRELRYLGAPFDVRPELADEDRRLMLVGTREPSQDQSGLRDRVAAAIREKNLEEIVWDNSAVSESLKLVSTPISSLAVGYHVIGGAHSFTALMEVARRDPERVVTALEPLFRARPEAPVHELDRRAVKLLRALSGARAARR